MPRTVIATSSSSSVKPAPLRSRPLIAPPLTPSRRDHRLRVGPQAVRPKLALRAISANSACNIGRSTIRSVSSRGVRPATPLCLRPHGILELLHISFRVKEYPSPLIYILLLEMSGAPAGFRRTSNKYHLIAVKPVEQSQQCKIHIIRIIISFGQILVSAWRSRLLPKGRKKTYIVPVSRY